MSLNELQSALSDIGEKFCGMQNYKADYEKQLLYELFERAKHSTYYDFYYTTDLRTRKKVFSKAKQKGIIELVDRIRKGEYKEFVNSYFGKGEEAEIRKRLILVKVENAVINDTGKKEKVGIFSKIKSKVNGFLKKRREYVLINR